MFFYIKRALLSAVILLWVSACSTAKFENSDTDISSFIKQQSIASTETNSVAEVPVLTQILAGDVIQVQFPFNSKFNAAHQVRLDGHISLPYAGDFLVSGKNISVIQTEIRNKYQQLVLTEANIPVNEKKYLIQAGDVLDIRFSYKPELDERVIVRPDGRISLPLVNSVIAEKVSPEELSELLEKKFSEFVNKPELVVIVEEFAREQFYVNGRLVRDQYKDLVEPVVTISQSAPRHIFVGGEVNRPGIVPYSGSLTALQAIIMSGGTKKSAEMRQVAIIRKQPNQKPRLIVRNLRSAVVQDDQENSQILNIAASDLNLKANDIVILPKNSISKVSDFLNQYIYDLVPFLRNSSLGIAYSINPVDEISTTNTENVIISTVE